MSDGASQGIKANDALKVIIGGEPAEDQPAMTAAEFAAWIRSCPDTEPSEETSAGDRYREASRLIVRCMLTAMEEDPTREWSISPTYRTDVYVVAKKANPHAAWAFKGCSGFMVGWAFNVAKSILGQPSIQNPAIITIELPDSDE